MIWYKQQYVFNGQPPEIEIIIVGKLIDHQVTITCTLSRPKHDTQCATLYTYKIKSQVDFSVDDLLERFRPRIDKVQQIHFKNLLTYFVAQGHHSPELWQGGNP